MDDMKAAVASAAVPLTFRCVESKTKTDEHGRFSYSGLLSALDEQGQHVDPRQGFPAKGSMHYATNGALAYPVLVEGKCYRLAFVEVDDLMANQNEPAHAEDPVEAPASEPEVGSEDPQEEAPPEVEPQELASETLAPETPAEE